MYVCMYVCMYDQYAPIGEPELTYEGPSQVPWGSGCYYMYGDASGGKYTKHSPLIIEDVEWAFAG